MERSEIRRVGGTRSMHFDVRVLAATRRDLEHEVQAGRFRDDLFHRLAVRASRCRRFASAVRTSPLLARHFWQVLGGKGVLPSNVIDDWSRRTWPGNVRELRNAVARRIALGDFDEPTKGAFPASEATEIDDVIERDLPYPRARRMVLAAFDRRYVARALEGSGGSVVDAAAASGIARRYFQIIRDRQRK